MSEDGKRLGDTRKGFLYALGGTVFGGTYFITGKYALRSFNAETFCFLWAMATALFTFAIIVARGRLGSLRVPKRAIPGLAVMGFLTGVGLVVLYSGLKRIDPSFQAFLARCHPVLTILLGVVFLRERLRAVELVPMALMLAGGVVSVWGRWEAVGVGVVLTLLGYVCFAVHRLLAKMASRRVGTEALVFYRGLIAWAVVTVWMLASGAADFDVETRYWVVLLLGALLAPCLGILLSFHSYKYWSLSRNAMLLMLQPLLVLPMAYVFLGMLPARQALAGGLLILVGAAWISWIHLSRSSRTLVPE